MTKSTKHFEYATNSVQIKLDLLEDSPPNARQIIMTLTPTDFGNQSIDFNQATSWINQLLKNGQLWISVPE